MLGRRVLRTAAAGAALAAALLTGCATAHRPDPVRSVPPGATASPVLVPLSSGTTTAVHWLLVSYRDSDGSSCLTVIVSGEQEIPACDIEVGRRQLVNAAIVVENDIALMYGRADPTVRHVYRTGADGVRHQLPLETDRLTGNRYFIVAFAEGTVDDVTAVSVTGGLTSLREEIQSLGSTR
ncbi:hypothetical protein [Streptomyces sp. NPDC005251]|uniref:hypothetical protein n=1 Tax=unclassified Streptomyces TaxID=2593676 RepID=UPI0033B4DC69